MSIKGDNKRIAKNTIFLYIRTIIVLFVSLYTSRLVLQALGETDLGIYNLVGGIVALMAFCRQRKQKQQVGLLRMNLVWEANRQNCQGYTPSA